MFTIIYDIIYIYITRNTHIHINIWCIYIYMRKSTRTHTHMYCMLWYVTALRFFWLHQSRDLFLSTVGVFEYFWDIWSMAVWVWHLTTANSIPWSTWLRAQVGFTEFVVKAANTTESTASEDLFKRPSECVQQWIQKKHIEQDPFSKSRCWLAAFVAEHVWTIFAGFEPGS